jgi:NAD-dependent deacetylase
VWEWYEWRRNRIAACAPNRAHEVLAQWSRRYATFTLITQNVDGLHERADTRNVVRFHGSLWEISCWERCSGSPPRWRDETVPFPSLPPRCPDCGGLARPGVVWFGEAIDAEVLETSVAALDCDVCVVVGTSGIVYPAAGLADEARRRGAFTVEINPEPTEATRRFNLAIPGKAEVVLDELERMLTGT